MNAAVLTLPREVSEIPMPEWATVDLGWELDVDDMGYTRTVERPCGDVVVIMQGQTWEPARGLIWHEREICGLDSIMALGDSEGATASDGARDVAAQLLEAARVLDAVRVDAP